MIDDYAFLGADVAVLRLPDTLLSIGDSAFLACADLKKVYYDGTSEQWNAIAIGSGNDALLKAERICWGDVSLGDINHDDAITLLDVMTLFYYTGGKTTLDEVALAASDIDGDNAIKLHDAVKLFYYTCGKAALN